MVPIDSKLLILAEKLGKCLLEKGLLLATAESCTGGWISEAVTAIPGSSAWFDRGFVTYSNSAKQEMLKVNENTLITYGAVSEQTVIEMAAGVLKNSSAQVSIAVSGIAGPEGGTAEKPVGTVWFGFALKGKTSVTQHCCFAGSRQEIRAQAVQYGLQALLDLVDKLA